MSGAQTELPAAFALLQFILSQRNEREGFIVGAFHELLRDPVWTSRVETKEHLHLVAEDFADYWESSGYPETKIKPSTATQSIARWLSYADTELRAALLTDLKALGEHLTKAAQPGFFRRKKRRQLQASVAQILKNALAQSDDVPHPTHERRRTAHNTTITSKMQAVGPGVWERGEVDLQLVQRVAETHDVNTFEFRALDGREFSYLPGQSATLSVPIDGEIVRRTYTISSSPTRPERLHFTIKRVPGGLVSNWLADNAQPGFELSIRGPGGRFSFVNQTPRKALFLSGGSGITPLLSMTRYCHDMSIESDIVFWHGARQPRDLICADELSVYARRMHKLRAVYCMSQPSEDDAWTGLSGYFTAEALYASVPDFEEREVYLCGPIPFMEAARRVFEESGFNMSRFHSESFGKPPKKEVDPIAATSPAALGKWIPSPSEMMESYEDALPPSRVSLELKTAPGGAPLEPASSNAATVDKKVDKAPAKPVGDTFAVKLSLSSKKFHIAKSSNLLDAVEDEGSDVDSSCRSGTCGTCKVKCTRGTIDFENLGGLSDDEEQDGYVLLCVGTAQSDIELEL